ncbi:MAG: hypothetical protein ACYTDW_12055 [Planctomycetota bacterium]|jgi:hypothetical protein
MKMRTEAEIQEAIAMHQLLGLCIGIVVVMIVAWLTLPSDEEQIVNRVCFQQCKEVISSNGEYGQLNIFSGPSYFEEMGKCHKDCTMEKNENID